MTRRLVRLQIDVLSGSLDLPGGAVEETMATIIGGIFGNIAQAKQALEDLLQYGFQRQDLNIFHVNPPGQHDTFPVGGDQDADPQAEDSHVDAAKGAVVGAAIGVGRRLDLRHLLQQ